MTSIYITLQLQREDSSEQLTHSKKVGGPRNSAVVKWGGAPLKYREGVNTKVAINTKNKNKKETSTHPTATSFKYIRND